MNTTQGGFSGRYWGRDSPIRGLGYISGEGAKEDFLCSSNPQFPPPTNGSKGPFFHLPLRRYYCLLTKRRVFTPTSSPFYSGGMRLKKPIGGDGTEPTVAPPFSRRRATTTARTNFIRCLYTTLCAGEGRSGASLLQVKETSKQHPLSRRLRRKVMLPKCVFFFGLRG